MKQHVELAWSPDSEHWQRISEGKLGALLLLMVSLAIAALEPSPLGSQLASV